MYRVGWLGPEDKDEAYFEPFLGQLRDLGWVEGQNFVMVYQLAPDQQFSGGGAHEVRPDHQSEDRQGDRTHDPARGALPGGQGDPVACSGGAGQIAY